MISAANAIPKLILELNRAEALSRRREPTWIKKPGLEPFLASSAGAESAWQLMRRGRRCS